MKSSRLLAANSFPKVILTFTYYTFEDIIEVMLSRITCNGIYLVFSLSDKQ